MSDQYSTVDLRTWIGRTVVDRSGDKIGSLDDIYADDRTGQAEWLAINTGLFGRKTSFVPIEGANLAGDGIQVAYDKSEVTAAPSAEPDGHLTEDEEQALYTHYRDSYVGSYGQGVDVEAPPRDVGTDEAMTRSEEEVQVTKTERPAGSARLKKWVETENVNITVPVTRERARLTTEPITEANRDAALSGPDLSSEEHEVVLTEEEIDVTKQVVPKERVRLETEQVTEQERVSEEVRKERIQAEGEITTATATDDDLRS